MVNGQFENYIGYEFRDDIVLCLLIVHCSLFISYQISSAFRFQIIIIKAKHCVSVNLQDEWFNKRKHAKVLQCYGNAYHSTHCLLLDCTCIRFRVTG